MKDIPDRIFMQTIAARVGCTVSFARTYKSFGVSRREERGFVG